MSAEIAVVGGGILGLSAARALSHRVPGARVIVLEKEPAIGLHQTGRASGVVHSGVYYTPGSLKARLCVQGARELIAFCEERGIPFQRCGKVIVATSNDELPRLEELHRRALANGVDGAELIGGYLSSSRMRRGCGLFTSRRRGSSISRASRARTPGTSRRRAARYGSVTR